VYFDRWWREWTSRSREGLTHVLYLARHGTPSVGIAGGVVAEGSVWLISMQGSLTRLLGGVVNPTLGDLLREGVAV
jgi:hypothetical protein